MKLLLLFLSVCSTAVFYAQTTTTVNLNVNGVSRTYNLYVPAIYNSNQAVPLVFNFHGYTSNNTQQELYGDFRPIADTANFIIVHPQGLIVNGNTGWNNFGTQATAQGDIDFTQMMITTLSSQYNIDPNRIYSTGMSNGGFMSYDLACFLSSRFAAIASVTGGMTALRKPACNPNHPVPVMQIHGTADAVVPYTGVTGFGSIHVDSLVKFWRVFNHCNATPVFTALPNINTADNCTAEHYVYSGGQNGSTVEFYKIIGGGHTWPGAIFPVNGNTNMDFSASKEIWRFFSKYRLNQLANVAETGLDVKINVYPNPSKDSFTIEVEQFQGLKIEILDVSGKQVYQQELKSQLTPVELKSAGSGLYFYKILNAEKAVASGKIALQ